MRVRVRVCYQGNPAWAVGLQGDIPEGFAAAAPDQETPAVQGAGLGRETVSLVEVDTLTHTHQ